MLAYINRRARPLLKTITLRIKARKLRELRRFLIRRITEV